MKQTISKNSTGPLKSWDIFLHSYQQLMQKGDDLQLLKHLSGKSRWKSQWDLRKELVEKGSVIVVTDMKRNIVFASKNIAGMTGYTPKELLGKKPEILQGVDTDKKILKYISSQITGRQPFEATIVNYRKNGEPYNCCIRAFPVFNDEDELVHFIAFEKAA